MLPLLTLSEASTLDKALIASCRLDEHALVSNAALGAYECYKEIFRGKRVLFVAGKGNNGSDALALLPLVLPVASSVAVYCHFDSGNEENEERRRALDPSLFVFDIVESDVIVDGLFGVKCRLPLDERTKALVDKINSSRATVVSLDCPSAFLIRADYTITFMCQKEEMYLPHNRAFCGRITLFNPGFPSSGIAGDGRTFLLSDDDYNPPFFGLADYKNTRGHVCIAAGSDRYPGAAVMSALSVFHAGAGKVSVLSSERVRNAVLSSYPSVMCADETTDFSLFDSFVVGPGWDAGSRKILEKVNGSGKNFVVDADGIKLLPGLRCGWRAVITPHLGEFGRLLSLLSIDEGSLIGNVKKVATLLECIVVLKGVTVIISDGERVYFCDGANPSLGVAGSGDVLSGVIGAFLAHGDNPLSAAMNGVLLHQRSGRKAHEEYGFYSAEDLIRTIGRER